LSILNEPWLIVPEKLRVIQDIYLTHLHGPKLPHDQIEAIIAKTGGNDNALTTYEVRDGVAIIPIQGVISKKMNLFTDISGGVSTEKIGSMVMEAMDDPGVKAVLLYVDSPGGTVDGTQELANVIANARDKKCIVAFTDGMMASAAYWLGAAAERIYINGDTTNVGSIGVVTEHMDVSKWEEQKGYKTTEITAGRYKRITSEYSPLTEEGKTYLQERVDAIYELFTREVASFRGMDQKKVKNTEARLYLGKDAIKAGIADGVSSMGRLLGLMSKDPQNFVRRARAEASIDEKRRALACQN